MREMIKFIQRGSKFGEIKVKFANENFVRYAALATIYGNVFILLPSYMRKLPAIIRIGEVLLEFKV